MQQHRPTVSVLVTLLVGLAMIVAGALSRNLGAPQKTGPEKKPKTRVELGGECKEGDAEACYDLGIMVGRGEQGPRDLARAHALVTRACKLSSQRACDFLPMMQSPSEP